MNKYTIPCTEEQAKKALELGAPIEIDTSIAGDYDFDYDNKVHISKNLAKSAPYQEYATIPTAEQMIGWLETLISFIDVIKLEDNTWLYVIYPYNESNKNITVRGFSSRPEATLAAIDAALDYLSNKK